MVEMSSPTSESSREHSIEFPYCYRGVLYNSKLKIYQRGCASAKHALITVHDVGLNAFSNFGTLLNSEFMQPIISKYSIYHVVLPGQEDAAKPLSDSFVYPSMENLSDAIPKVLQQFNLKSAVFLGDGAGSNILTRFAMKNPALVDGLIIVNPIISVVGNFSWISEKITNFNTPFSDQLMNYRFSEIEMSSRPHLFETHRQHLLNVMNINNVQTFFCEFERRDDIPIHRSYDPQTWDLTTLKCDTLIMVGDLSPFVDEAVEMNSRLNPEKTTFLKMADIGGMLLEEELFNVSEAICFFLQGLGHIPSVMMKRLARSKNHLASDYIEEVSEVSALGWEMSSSNEKAFNNRDQDEVIAVHSGERIPLMQENLC